MKPLIAKCNFPSRRHKCPERYNPAEFFADLIAYDYSTPDLETASRERVAKLQKGFVGWQANHATGGTKEQSKEGGEKPLIKRPKQAVGKQGSSWQTQFRLLLERSWRQVGARWRLEMLAVRHNNPGSGGTTRSEADYVSRSDSGLKPAH